MVKFLTFIVGAFIFVITFPFSIIFVLLISLFCFVYRREVAKEDERKQIHLKEKINYYFSQLIPFKTDYFVELNSPKYKSLELYLSNYLEEFIEGCHSPFDDYEVDIDLILKLDQYASSVVGKCKHIKRGVVQYLVMKNLSISNKTEFGDLFRSLWIKYFNSIIENMIKCHEGIKLNKNNQIYYPVNYAIDALLDIDINQDIESKLLFYIDEVNFKTVENSFKKGIAEYYLSRIYAERNLLEKELFLDHFEKCILSLEETFPSQDMFDDPGLYWKNFFLANYAFFIIYKLKNQFSIENGAIFTRQVKITEFAIWEKRQKEKGLHPLFKSNF